MSARTEPARRKAASANASASKAAPVKVAAKSTTTAKPKAQPKVAANKSKSAKDSAITKAKFHVVKPQETLYRVAVINGISVDQLRKVNRLGPNDNNIRPGQKLKVGS